MTGTIAQPAAPRPRKRTIYRGYVEDERALSFLFLVCAAVAALVWVVWWGIGYAGYNQHVAQVVAWAATGATVLSLALVVANHVNPVRAWLWLKWPLRRGQRKPTKYERNRSRYIARHWHKLAKQLWAPCTAAGGDYEYPGLLRIVMYEDCLCLVIRMPSVRPSGSWGVYIDQPKESAPSVCNVHAMFVDIDGQWAKHGNIYMRYRVIAEDATANARTLRAD